MIILLWFVLALQSPLGQCLRIRSSEAPNCPIDEIKNALARDVEGKKEALRRKMQGGDQSPEQKEQCKGSLLSWEGYLSPEERTQDRLNIRPPMYILSYGPPGCGKSSSLKSLDSAMIDNKNFVKFNPTCAVKVIVDDFVKEYEGYAEQRIRCGTKEGQQQIYWTLRKDPKFAIDSLSDEVSTWALHNVKDLVVETTGGSVDWFADEYLQSYWVRHHANRATVLLYPWVPVEETLRRLKARKTQENAPEEQVREDFAKAAANLKRIMIAMTTVVIVNNNGPPNQVAPIALTLSQTSLVSWKRQQQHGPGASSAALQPDVRPDQTIWQCGDDPFLSDDPQKAWALEDMMRRSGVNSEQLPGGERRLIEVPCMKKEWNSEKGVFVVSPADCDKEGKTILKTIEEMLKGSTGEGSD